LKGRLRPRRTWTRKTCFDEDVRRRGEEGLEWIKGKVPSLLPLEQQEEEGKEEEEVCDDEDESDESEYDEDY
jgi:hypothetical protein